MVNNQLTFIHEFVTGKGHRRLNVELNMVSVNVEGGVRPLQATWTPELTQDLTAYHNIDAEAELTAMLAEQVGNEIDQEIINNLHNMVDDFGERAPQDPIQPRQGGIRTPNDVLMRQREEIVERWAATGLLEGLGEPNRRNIAELMESQAQTLLNEQPQPTENNFENVTLPIVRRVFTVDAGGRLVDNDIVPIGNVRYNEFNHNLGLGGNDHNNNFFGDWLRRYDEQHLEGVIWRTDETWTYETLYGSIIGITMDLEPLKMVEKTNYNLFDLVTLPSVRRVFT
jgi:hypothetical protein